MKQRPYAFIGIMTTSISILFLLMAPRNIHFIIQVIEQQISPDGLLDTTTKIIIGIIYLSFDGILGFLGFLLIGLIDLKRVFLVVKPMLLPTIVGLLFYASFELQHILQINHLYIEDSLFESATAALFLFSAAFFAISAYRSKKYEVDKNGILIIYLLLFSFTSIVIGMEEISWGQRIIGWDTPEVFAANQQNETNVHNFLLKNFENYIHILFRATVFLSVVVSSWLSFKQKHSPITELILPPYHLLGLGLFVIIFYGELAEELLSVFFIFFALSVYGKLRKENSEKGSN